MATYKGGPLNLFKGKLGRTVSYPTKLGYNVVREIGFRTAPFTPAELENQKGTRLVSLFLSPVMEVIRIGYKNIPEGKSWHAYNHATSVVKRTALMGAGSTKQIDYEKVRFSIGDIPVPKDPAVELIDNRLHFTWDADLDAEGTDGNDRIMIVAYYPETLKATYLLSGAKRTEEKESILLPKFTERTIVETYISYIGSDGNMLSDSVYTGQIIGEIN
jgi:hypothetical protein